MKKIITTLLVIMSLAIIGVQSSPVEAQPVTYCCDTNGMRRCVIPPGPTGVICYCNGIPGNGFSCW